MNYGPLTLLLIFAVVIVCFKLFSTNDPGLSITLNALDIFNKTIVVSGGAGFIGSNLVRHLLKDKTTFVYVIDNLSSGKNENLKPFFNRKNFKFYKTDIRFSVEQSVDEIYHLASFASPDDFMKNRIETFEANFDGAKNLLKQAKAFNAKILFTSSSEVYGDPLKSPQDEHYNGNVNPVGARSSYDESKRATEALFEAYRVQKNVSTRIVRIFNTYGPGMSVYDSRLISSAITKALKNQPITIFGNGNQTRSFMFVDDLIRGLVLTMQSNYHEPINLGNPEELTVNEVVMKIIRFTNSSSKVIYGEARPDDPMTRKPNISLAKKVLNWKPTVGFDEGLKKTIEYFKGLDYLLEQPRERLVLF